MADFKQSAGAAALLVTLVASATGLAEEPGSAAREAAQPTREEARSKSPEASRPERSGTFAPTTSETDRATLEPLDPIQPRHPDPVFKTLERQGSLAAPLAWPEETRPGELQQTPLESLEHRSEDPRLHQDLTWDYCGPRPGVTDLDPMSALRDDSQTPVDITADLVDYDRNQDLIQLRGDIEILQNDRRIEAERSSYDRGTGEVKASGQVYLDYPGLRLTGDAAEYNLETKQGRIDKAGYRLSGNANLRGAADRAWMLDEQRSRYRDVLYTTCPPGGSDWSIKASDLELDQNSGIGVARDARLRILDIPVLYSPYLRFPIDGRRRSGLLIPTFGSSEETGTDISLPYYWNIAPNMDATLTPRLMSARGLMLGAQFRHLASFQRFEIDGEILPSDQKDEDEGLRGALRMKQYGNLGARWSSSIDYASVSDDRYLGDFGNRLDVTSVRNLSQRADVNYAGDGWRMLGRFQQFQTVDTSIAPANRPYGQLPHIELAIAPATWNQLVEYSFESQYDYFDHNAAVHGSRLVAIPSLRLPVRRGFGHLIPRARLFYTQYDLVDQTEGASTQPTHVIPSLDLDGKLILERDTNWLGTSALQTLEPRLYYVLTSYQDQSDNPRFDTTALDFSFASLFRSNRFTGYDRVGDENRLTLGLTSRTIDNRAGEELFRASLGQVYYFDKRRVQLTDDYVEDDSGSSVAGELAARLHTDWTAQASLQWNPNETEQPWEKQVLQLRYAPDSERLINLAYRYNLGNQESEEYEDTDLSFQMPLGSRVRVVGRWLYSMLNDETVEAFAGVEFGRCCWRLRVLGQHLKRSANDPASTSVMLQLELAGLGSFGNQIDRLLERGIYGYQSE
ncbi:LPS-assembly protein LptD [Thiocystis violacea]|uniref:LPS-assembly protein LptD n=1 Tax=Thiocystis violacea TaxID=13725 RepID=UPI001F5BE376|nr:LPS-assembly protein LptD [Thiocystis violacea]